MAYSEWITVQEKISLISWSNCREDGVISAEEGASYRLTAPWWQNSKYGFDPKVAMWEKCATEKTDTVRGLNASATVTWQKWLRL